MSLPPVWRVLAASTAGTRHVSRGSACQDANAHRLLDDGTLLIAVADGAGSASRSKEGAECATLAAVEFLAAHLAGMETPVLETVIRDAMSAARSAVEALAAEGSSLNDFATTLLLTVITDSLVSTLQVGDGAIVAQLSDGESLDVLTAKGDSEYVNQTTFLTSNGYLEAAYFASRPAASVRAVAVMTDGMQLLAVHHANNTAFGAFFKPMFRFAADPTATDQALADFLTSEAVCRRTDDDKTLVLTVRQ
ncbi:MAG: PP2C family serine/threonine-protein phosphatase [Bryobacteraceae bacterium]